MDKKAIALAQADEVIILSEADEALERFPNLLARIMYAMLREHKWYACVIGDRKVYIELK